jgi:hypothetical protein
MVSIPLAIKLVSAANAVTFFGLELGDNPKFIQTAMQYPEELFIMAEILYRLPTGKAPLVSRLLKCMSKAAEKLLRYLSPVVATRMHKYAIDPSQSKHTGLIQLLVVSNQQQGVQSASFHELKAPAKKTRFLERSYEYSLWSLDDEHGKCQSLVSDPYARLTGSIQRRCFTHTISLVFPLPPRLSKLLMEMLIFFAVELLLEFSILRFIYVFFVLDKAEALSPEDAMASN